MDGSRIEHIPFALHESPRLMGCVCNGCLRLEVLEKRRNKYESIERYYCKAVRHGYFDPHKVKSCDASLYSTNGICKKPSRSLRLDA